MQHEEKMSAGWSVRELTGKQFDELSANSALGGFQQTSAMARLAASDGADTQFLGLTDEHGTPVAGAMVAYTKGRFGLEGSIWLGPLCDSANKEQLTALTVALRAAAHKRGAISVTCWPAQVYRLHDSNGEPTENPDNALIDAYVSLGWRHAGFTRGYASIVNRWNYVKDLDGIADERALLKSYDKRTQWSVKRAASMGVHVRELDDSELKVFADIEQATAERRSFEYRGEEYFHRFKKAYGSSAHFMVAEIHIAEYKADMEAKVDALKAKVDTLKTKIAERETTRLVRQLGEESRNLAAAEKRLAEAGALARKGDVLPAAASLFVEHPRETVYLFSGSVEEYKPFYASALIQHYAMLHLCLERGVNRYNFYGIDGVFDDPDDEGRGVLEFKQGFNGYVEELPGEFVLPVRPVVYRVKTALRHLLSR